MPSERCRLLATCDTIHRVLYAAWTRNASQVTPEELPAAAVCDSYGRGDDNTARTKWAKSKNEPNAFQYVLQGCLPAKQQE